MKLTAPRSAILLLGALGSGATAAAAATGDTADFLTFDAFGTLGVAHSDESRADFNRSAFLPNGAGASGAWSAAVDSLLAGQVRAEFTPRLSGTVQVVSELRHDKSFSPHVEWAYLSFDATPELAVRVGRTSSPVDPDAAVLRVVRANPAAIGYIDRESADDTVRILD